VQYESARIVTGLRKGTSRIKLYGELGWDSLQNRRKKQKLILMFKALATGTLGAVGQMRLKQVVI
jgi:hypothetical protein